jgi:hypothetical protein
LAFHTLTVKANSHFVLLNTIAKREIRRFVQMFAFSFQHAAILSTVQSAPQNVECRLKHNDTRKSDGARGETTPYLRERWSDAAKQFLGVKVAA